VRRAVAAVLVLVSLALLTVYLREPEEGGLHAAQRLGLSILAPFAVAGERIARPFQDAYGYVSDLVAEKDATDELRTRVAELEAELRAARTAAAENEQLREALQFVDGPRFPDDFRPVATRIIAQPAGPYNQNVVVAAGTDAGVTRDAPVVAPDGSLVGVVTDVSDGQAQVRLLTDPSARVSAKVVGGAEALGGLETRGLVQPSPSAGAGLILDRVDKEALVEIDDVVVTSGWRAGEISSVYPAGIPIGRVTNVGVQDIDLFQRIQLESFADFDALSEVVILVPR
jgi:rod shape-determining protein MreC